MTDSTQANPTDSAGVAETIEWFNKKFAVVAALPVEGKVPVAILDPIRNVAFVGVVLPAPVYVCMLMLSSTLALLTKELGRLRVVEVAECTLFFALAPGCEMDKETTTKLQTMMNPTAFWGMAIKNPAAEARATEEDEKAKAEEGTTPGCSCGCDH